MRKRTRTTSWDGSMCTSEARSRMAWVRIRSTTWTMGASSATTSASAVSADPSAGALHGLEGLDELVDAADGPVVAVDGPLDVGLGGQDEPDRVVGRLQEQRLHFRRGLVGDGHLESVVVEPDRNRQVLTHDCFRNQVRWRSARDCPVADRRTEDAGDPRAPEPGRAGSAHPSRPGSRPILAGLLLDDQCSRHVVFGDQPPAHQQGSERLGTRCRARADASRGPPPPGERCRAETRRAVPIRQRSVVIAAFVASVPFSLRPSFTGHPDSVVAIAEDPEHEGLHPQASDVEGFCPASGDAWPKLVLRRLPDSRHR